MSTEPRLSLLQDRSGQSLSRRIADDLIDRVKEGEYRPGDRMPAEHELMRVYGVGRNTVREAMQALVALGLIEIRPRRGATVLAASTGNALPPGTLSALLDTTAVSDLYEVRMLIEVEAAGRAARRRSANDLEAIKHTLTHFRLAFETGAPVWSADVDFHYAIAVASGNTALPRILEATSELLSNARRATQSVPGAVAMAAVEHAAIAEAIEAGDEALARKTMTQHIKSAIWALKTLTEAERSTPPSKLETEQDAGPTVRPSEADGCARPFLAPARMSQAG